MLEKPPEGSTATEADDVINSVMSFLCTLSDDVIKLVICFGGTDLWCAFPPHFMLHDILHCVPHHMLITIFQELTESVFYLS